MRVPVIFCRELDSFSLFVSLLRNLEKVPVECLVLLLSKLSDIQVPLVEEYQKGSKLLENL